MNPQDRDTQFKLAKAGLIRAEKLWFRVANNLPIEKGEDPAESKEFQELSLQLGVSPQALQQDLAQAELGAPDHLQRAKTLLQEIRLKAGQEKLADIEFLLKVSKNLFKHLDQNGVPGAASYVEKIRNLQQKIAQKKSYDQAQKLMQLAEGSNDLTIQRTCYASARELFTAAGHFSSAVSNERKAARKLAETCYPPSTTLQNKSAFFDADAVNAKYISRAAAEEKVEAEEPALPEYKFLIEGEAWEGAKLQK